MNQVYKINRYEFKAKIIYIVNDQMAKASFNNFELSIRHAE